MQFFDRDGARAIFGELPIGFDLTFEFRNSECFDQYLDARFVDVVAPTVFVIHAHDGFQIRDGMLPRHEVAYFRAYDRRASQAAAHQHTEADFALRIFHHRQADVMYRNRGPVICCASNRDLEFTRQVSELRMKGAPLAQYLGVRARIDDFITCHAREFIAGDVAYAIARGLVAMHFNAGQVRHQIRHIFQLEPVVLNVLTRGEMPVASIVFARDMRKHAYLRGTHQTIRHGNTQHVSMYLHIQTILQTQDAEFIFAQLTRQAAAHLVAELRDALVYNLVVIFIIAIHWILLERDSSETLGFRNMNVVGFIRRITLGHGQQQCGGERKLRAILQNVLHIRILVMTQCRAYVGMLAGLTDHHTDASAAAVEPADLFGFVGFVGTHQLFLTCKTPF